MSGAEFLDLAGGAGDRVLMAFAAGLRIEDRAKSIADGFGFFKFAAIHCESGRVRQAVGLIVVT